MDRRDVGRPSQGRYDASGDSAGSRSGGSEMTDSELELCGTQELIEELLRRSTFQGVIVHAAEEAKSADWDGERVFRVRFNANLAAEEAGRLLDVVGQHLIDADRGI